MRSGLLRQWRDDYFSVGGWRRPVARRLSAWSSVQCVPLRSRHRDQRRPCADARKWRTLLTFESQSWPAWSGSFVPFTMSPDALLWSLRNSMHAIKTSFGPTERNEGVAFEAAAVLASPGPLGVVTMGTFPLSLIAFGWTTRHNLDNALASRAKSH
jgi:hypothetical protein